MTPLFILAIILFFTLVSLSAFFTMPRIKSLLLALISSILIPYGWVLLITTILLSKNLYKKLQAYESTKLIVFSFLKETIVFIYFGFGIWVISLVIFAAWVKIIYIPQQKSK